MKSTLALAVRLVVGGVLLYAGFLKAVGPTAEFAAAIEAYKILPAPFISPLAFALPYIEMWIGTYLVFGFCTRPLAMAAAGLFTVFLGVLGSALLRHIDLASCGCFGADMLSPKHTILLDLSLLVFSALLTRFPSHPYSLDTWLEK